MSRCSEVPSAIFYESRYFPQIWKTSYVKHIFKGDSKISNYRPITIISAIPKNFDSLVCDDVSAVLSRQLTNKQHEFVRNWSDVSNLVVFQNTILEAFETLFILTFQKLSIKSTTRF